MTSGRRTISAADFKARCLALMDEVNATGETLVVTKRGRPVARVVSAEAAPRRSLRGSVRCRDDLVGHVDEPWDADR
jgi:prevent-host-death family protein